MQELRPITFLMTMILSNIVYGAGIVSPSNSTIDFPHDQSHINTNQPTIIGLLRDAEKNPVPGTTVVIVIDGVALGNAVSDENGIYRFALATPLDDGAYDLSVFCDDIEIGSESHRFTIDTTLPPIAITYPREREEISSGHITIIGMTEENAMVQVFLDEDIFGNVCYADASGNWSIDYEIGNGDHVVIAQATDIAGNQGPVSEMVNFTVILT